MSESASKTPASGRLWSLLLSLSLPLLALLRLGQDRNWDLQNYHLYNPFAWLHGRLLLDIAPAQVQSWHNPLLDMPLYLMTRAGWPGFAIGLWLTLPMMLALYLLLRMYPLLSTKVVTRSRLGLLAVLATTGAAAYAELGTCFNDAFVAVGMLGSLSLLLRGNPDAQERSSAWCLAGVLAGATAGLKLTAIVYCLGLVGAATCMPSWRLLPRRLIGLLLGGIIGLSLTYGYWGALLLHLHGNPFFPYYNQIFHSADASFTAHADPRFRPHGFGDALLIPFRLLQATRRYSELMLRDPRLLLGMAGSVLLLWQARRASIDTDGIRAARLRMLTGFFFVSFSAWAAQSGIYRYLLPLELLACLNLMLVLDRLPLRWRDAGAIAACVLIVAVTLRPSWGRSHFGSALVDVRMPKLPLHSMVVLSGGSPLAYAVTALPDGIAAISVENNFMVPGDCTGLSVAAERRIRSHVGPLWLLRRNDAADDQGEQDASRAYGLVVAGACLPVATNIDALRLCPLRRDPEPVLCAAAVPAPGP